MVGTDAEAFLQVRDRLQRDVGRIIRLEIILAWLTHTAPFWALARMLFPIAEAIGDLMYQSAGLVKGIEELKSIRPGYGGKAAILAQLFRHPLMHTDELRKVTTPNGKTVVWRLGFREPQIHLREERLDPDRIRISFDLTTFYHDLLALCANNASKSFGGRARDRYNAWLTRKLDPSEKQAIAEIEDLFKRP